MNWILVNSFHFCRYIHLWVSPPTITLRKDGGCLFSSLYPCMGNPLTMIHRWSALKILKTTSIFSERDLQKMFYYPKKAQFPMLSFIYQSCSAPQVKLFCFGLCIYSEDSKTENILQRSMP